MKSFYIPLGVLTTILVFSLLTSHYVDSCTRRWTNHLTQAAQAADANQWEHAEAFLVQAEKDWSQNQFFFHTIMEHDDLDCAESLLTGTFAACREQDSVEFQILLAQLRKQLNLLSESQSASIKNIL